MGKRIYFYGMNECEINTFIGALKFEKHFGYLNCANGKAFYCHNEHGERVLVLRAGVLEMYIRNGAEWEMDLNPEHTPAGYVDEKEELREEIRIADKIFIQYGVTMLHPTTKKKKSIGGEVENKRKMKSQFHNHEDHQALLYIERGKKDGEPDRWYKYDVQITPDTKIRKSAHNKRFYSTIRPHLMKEYGMKRANHEIIGKSVRVDYGYGVLNYCSLVVCRIIQDLTNGKYRDEYNPADELKTYSEEVIEEMKTHGKIVGGRKKPENFAAAMRNVHLQWVAYYEQQKLGKGELEIVCEKKNPGKLKKKNRSI